MTLSITSRHSKSFFTNSTQGTPPPNLIKTVLSDLEARKFHVLDIVDFMYLRELAFDRAHWRSCTSEGDLLVPKAGVQFTLFYLFICLWNQIKVYNNNINNI